MEFHLDTGAERTVLRKASFDKLNVDLEGANTMLVGADGSELKVLGEVDVRIRSKRKLLETRVSVVKGASRNLLGIKQIRALDLLALVNSVCETAFDPVDEFPKLFHGLGKMPGTFTIKLKSDTRPVCLYSPRPIAAGLVQQAKEELDKMLQLGVIEPVERATKWCSALTIAPKQNGKIRMCVDLTALNKGVEREAYPLPRVSDMLAKLSTGRVFSKVDANAGFWQVQIDPESKLLTTFITAWGRFCFRRMPFGISSAPEYYQRAMEKILHGAQGVVCLMDDVLIFGSNESEHWSRLRSVLDKIQKAGVTLRKEKCEFGSTSVKFLGHIISADGVSADPSKIKVIVEMNPPSSKKECKRFMGMVNYLGKFSDKLSKLAIPIYAVMNTKAEFVWLQDQKDAFDKIKAEITTTPVLVAFDLSRKHRVSADASQYALGAVLLQGTDKGNWQPVEYASRKLTEVEVRYAMVEKEALGITWACEKFDYYLVGRVFEIETDHKPLVAILGEKDLSKLPIRVQRFKMRMMRYNYVIFHTPGPQMLIADALSRPHNQGCDDRDIKRCAAVEVAVEQRVEQCINVLDDAREEELITESMTDPVVQLCLSFIEEGWPSTNKRLRGEIRLLYGARDRLTCYGNLVMYDSRLYIPYNLRKVYITRCHAGHQAEDKTLRRAKLHFWWPGMYSEIMHYVSKCEPCKPYNRMKHEPLMVTPLPDHPWQEVGSDIFVFKDMLYLILVDYYSKWIEALHIEAQTSAEVVLKMNEAFSRLGMPRVLRCDNGSCYTGSAFQEYADKKGFKVVTSSPRYPCSNGLAERAVGIVKRLWSKGGDRLDALLAYRTTPLKSGFTPAELMFGRHIRSELGEPHDIADVCYELFEELYDRSNKKKVEQWNKKYRAKTLCDLKVGQRVWVKAPTDKGREGTIVRKDKNPRSWWVRVGSGEVRRNRKHLFVLDSSKSEDDSSDNFVSCDSSWDFSVSIPSDQFEDVETENEPDTPVSYGCDSNSGFLNAANCVLDELSPALPNANPVDASGVSDTVSLEIVSEPNVVVESDTGSGEALSGASRVANTTPGEAEHCSGAAEVVDADSEESLFPEVHPEPMTMRSGRRVAPRWDKYYQYYK